MKVRIRVGRLNHNRLLQHANGWVPFSIHQINNTKIVIGEELIRIRSQLNLEFLYCFSQETRFSIGAAKDNSELGPISELPDHAVKNLLGGNDLMLLEIS